MYGENIADLRRARILAGLARGIGGGRPQLLPDRLGDSNSPIVFPKLLDILALPSRPNTLLVGVSKGCGRGRSRGRTGRSNGAQFPHQLEMLDLILSYRDETSFIQQHVGRLQHG